MGETDKKFSGVKNCIKQKIHGSILVSEKFDSNSNGGRDDEDNVTEALLPARKGGLSTKSGKPKRKVQWNDINGNKLAEVKEFQPRALWLCMIYLIYNVKHLKSYSTRTLLKIIVCK